MDENQKGLEIAVWILHCAHLALGSLGSLNWASRHWSGEGNMLAWFRVPGLSDQGSSGGPSCPLWHRGP